MAELKVTFNGVELTRGFALMDGLSRPLPEFRHATADIDGMDGSEFQELTWGMRVSTVSLAAVNADPVSLQRKWRELAAALMVRRPAALAFSDEKDAYGTQLVRYAVPSGLPDYDEWVGAGRVTLTFEQPDPHLYGRSRSIVLAAGVAAKVETGGNAPALPTAVLKAPASAASAAFRLLTAAGSVSKQVEVTFPSGSARTVTIDSERLRASISPADSGGITTGSRFFELSGTARILATAPATVSWRERWL